MCAGIPFEIAIGTKIGSTTDMVAILEPMQAWTLWLLSANKKLEFPDQYKFFRIEENHIGAPGLTQNFTYGESCRQE